MALTFSHTTNSQYYSFIYFTHDHDTPSSGNISDLVISGSDEYARRNSLFYSSSSDLYYISSNYGGPWFPELGMEDTTVSFDYTAGGESSSFSGSIGDLRGRNTEIRNALGIPGSTIESQDSTVVFHVRGSGTRLLITRPRENGVGSIRFYVDVIQQATETLTNAGYSNLSDIRLSINGVPTIELDTSDYPGGYNQESLTRTLSDTVTVTYTFTGTFGDQVIENPQMHVESFSVSGDNRNLLSFNDYASLLRSIGFDGATQLEDRDDLVDTVIVNELELSDGTVTSNTITIENSSISVTIDSQESSGLAVLESKVSQLCTDLYTAIDRIEALEARLQVPLAFPEDSGVYIYGVNAVGETRWYNANDVIDRRIGRSGR